MSHCRAGQKWPILGFILVAPVHPVCSSLAPDRPYQGLWVGDYSAHGIEFLLVIQRESYTLEIIKLTGDRNVPRSEYTVIVPDLRMQRTLHNDDYPAGLQNARVVQGIGQIAGTGFYEPQWVDIHGTFRISKNNVSLPEISRRIVCYLDTIASYQQL